MHQITNTQYEYIYTRIGRAFSFSWSLLEVSLFCVILKCLFLSYRELRITRPKGAHMSWFINVIYIVCVIDSLCANEAHEAFARFLSVSSSVPFCHRSLSIILISLNKYRKDVELSNGYRTSETTVVHNDN